MSEKPELKLRASVHCQSQVQGFVTIELDYLDGTVSNFTLHSDYAEYFIRAIDSHDALLAACKGANTFFETIQGGRQDWSAMRDLIGQLRTAIRAAEPQKREDKP